MSAPIAPLLKAQVERANASRSHHPIVTLTAEFPGDGSQTSMDWWLRKVNLLTSEIGIFLEFEDSQMVRSDIDPIRVAQLENRLAEAQSYINDLEMTMQDKVDAKVQEILGKQNRSLSPEEDALRAVEAQGFYLDADGAKWVDIRTEAKRIGKTYITLWRATKEDYPNYIETWVVGSTKAKGDRMLVKQGSFVKTPRKKTSS